MRGSVLRGVHRMSPRMLRHGALLLALGAAVTIMAAAARPETVSGPPSRGVETEVAQLRGAGSWSWLERLACVGCIGTIYAAGGGTPLGIVTVGVFRPDVIVACGTICYMAAT